MSLQEKRKLGQDIRSLPPDYLRGVWEIVSDGNGSQKEELQFDIDLLSVRKCRELEQYVKKSLHEV